MYLLLSQVFCGVTINEGLLPVGPGGPIAPLAPVGPLGPVAPVGPCGPVWPCSPVHIQQGKRYTLFNVYWHSAYVENAKEYRKRLRLIHNRLIAPVSGQQHDNGNER